MSVRYVVSEPAEKDLLDIALHVAMRGPEAVDRVTAQLDAKMALAAEHPGIGHSRDDLSPGLRAVVAGQYVILYPQTDYGILVVRVFPGARDFGSEFAS